MRLHSARVSRLARDIITPLIRDKDIEVTSEKEVCLDVEAVLNQYIRDEQQVTERARDLIAQRSLPGGELARVRKLVADERKIKIGEEAIDYILDQLLQAMMHSSNVDEIFSEDYELRRKMREPLRREEESAQDLVAEVRAQLKHVQEGTSTWEVEYRRVMEEIKRRKGI